jgi:sugar phosphate isomerase/epimerase
MYQFGIFSWFSYEMPMEDRFKKIKDAGFHATSLWWDEYNKQYHPDMARKCGLEIDNIHTPFNNANDFWYDSINGDDYLKILITCINDCNDHQIPVAVIHITGMNNPPEITEIGKERLKKLIHNAEDKGVCLAFENLNYLQHVDYIFSTFDSDYVGFCYDSGHENFYHKNANCLLKYGHKLSAIHIDDNFGDNDTHLLPFDGNVDWSKFKTEIKKARKLKYYSLEVDFNKRHEKSRIYNDINADEFLTLAYKRINTLMNE